MTSAALTKLFIILLLAFIMCLPEFFSSHRALKIHFLCWPFDPCDIDTGRGVGCGSAHVAGIRGTEEASCEGCVARATGDPDCSRTGKESDRDGTGVGWFECVTEMDLRSLHGNTSLSEVDMEVSLVAPAGSLSPLNVTLGGRFNRSTLISRTEEDQGLFHCCDLPKTNASQTPTQTPNPDPTTPNPSPSTPAGNSRCLLHTHTIDAALLRTRPQEETQWCVNRVLWLVLILTVVLTVLMTVVGRVFWRRRCCRKKTVPVLISIYQPSQFIIRPTKPLSDFPDVSVSLTSYSEEEIFTEITSPEVSDENLQSMNQRGLSPIHEDEITAHLHHRGHPPSLGLISESGHHA